MAWLNISTLLREMYKMFLNYSSKLDWVCYYGGKKLEQIRSENIQVAL